MITKITGEQPFQVLTNNFSISPSSEGYTLQISADGKNYSNLFTVGAGVTRLVTGVAANSFYRLSGNQSQVSINWMKTCVTEGGSGGSGTELSPVTEFPLEAEAGTVVAYNGTASASGVYQYTGEEWVPVGVDDLSNYWTSAQTQSAITIVEDHLYDVEQVTASALTELHDVLYDVEQVTASALTELHEGLVEVSGRSVSTEEIELPIAAAVNDLKGNIEARLSQKYYTRQEVNDIAAGKTDPAQVDVQIKDYVDPAIAEVNETIEDKELPVSAAINDLNTNKVSGVGITKIQEISQADYDSLAVKDPTTLYIINN